jgi:type III secretion system low calcium response chaperone LcrH/SycD
MTSDLKKNTSDQNFEEQVEKFAQVFDNIAGKIVHQDMSTKQALGINNESMEGMYAQAYRLYNTGKYVEAIHLFRMLIMMNSREPKYMLGLAACFHMLREYRNAIEIYTLCLLLDPHNPIPHYHSSDCFIQLKDDISAMVSLEMAIHRSENIPMYAKMKERAQLSLNNLKSKAAAKEKLE